ncbi:MAG: DUF2461 domain-containing protein [Pseudonocardia sp.]
MSGFEGFPPELFAFYEGLVEDNSKSYWDAHKSTWVGKVREPMKALLAELEGDFLPLRMFRPNRDLRFAKDKSPYKLWVGGTSESTAVGGTGYYVHVEATGMVIGCGAMQMASDQIKRFRAAIDDDRTGRDFEERAARLAAESLPVSSGFEPPLKTMPRGFSTEHPRAEFLRWKGAIVIKEYERADWMGTREALDVVRGIWKGADPLKDWIDEYVAASVAKAR